MGGATGENRWRGTRESSLSLANLSTKRQRIAALARAKRGVTLSTLHHVIDLEWMKEAYRLTRKDGAPGIDGVTATDYATNLEAKLSDLLDRIKSGRPSTAGPPRLYSEVGWIASTSRPSDVHRQARPVDRIADAAEQAPDLLLGQRLRQPLLPRRGDPFFPRTAPRPDRACGSRRTAARSRDLERAARHPALAQTQQVAAHFLFAELVRRAPVERSQLPDRPNVRLPGPFGQPGQDHVLDHPCTQWRQVVSLGGCTGGATQRPPDQGILPAKSPWP